MERYTRHDLYYDHYTWTDNDRVDGSYTLDSQSLDILNGSEVLDFATVFLDLYMPDHTVDDLNSLEHILMTHLPNYLTAKNLIASWMAKHLWYFAFVKTNRVFKYV